MVQTNRAPLFTANAFACAFLLAVYQMQARSADYENACRYFIGKLGCASGDVQYTGIKLSTITAMLNLETCSEHPLMRTDGKQAGLRSGGCAVHRHQIEHWWCNHFYAIRSLAFNQSSSSCAAGEQWARSWEVIQITSAISDAAVIAP